MSLRAPAPRSSNLSRISQAPRPSQGRTRSPPAPRGCPPGPPVPPCPRCPHLAAAVTMATAGSGAGTSPRAPLRPDASRKLLSERAALTCPPHCAARPGSGTAKQGFHRLEVPPAGGHCLHPQNPKIPKGSGWKGLWGVWFSLPAQHGTGLHPGSSGISPVKEAPRPLCSLLRALHGKVSSHVQVEIPGHHFVSIPLVPLLGPTEQILVHSDPSLHMLNSQLQWSLLHDSLLITLQILSS